MCFNFAKITFGGNIAYVDVAMGFSAEGSHVYPHDVVKWEY
jgi:hypothetical protein